MSQHRGALITVTVALCLDAVLGWLFAVAEHIPVWHGLYCALANAVTLGGDVAPTNSAGYVVTALECITVVPLFAATFSLFTSGLTAVHVQVGHRATVAQVKTELAAAMSEVKTQLGGVHRRLDDHADLIRAATKPGGM